MSGLSADDAISSVVIESEYSCRCFSLAEIQSMTNNFNEELVIGVGGFGKVYKGFIDNGATAVAIKRLKAESNQGAEEFWNEVKILSQLRHTHLVDLIGQCSDCQEMILVYKYIACGTLADHLYKISRNQTEISTFHLTWEQRLNICIGAARGLDYVHTGTDQSFIHRDVKTTNILLDENWVPKISDFGLSKGATSNSETHVSTNVKGTFGYLDPDYFYTRKLTKKSDVYAFGVVLLEVLCGRPPVDVRLEEEEINLILWVQQHNKKGKVDQIIDPSLIGQITPQSLKYFVEVANNCLHISSKERPTMAEVMRTLDLALLSQRKGRPKRIIEKVLQGIATVPKGMKATSKGKKKINTEASMCVKPIQVILPLPSSTLSMHSSLPSLRQSIPLSLCPGLTPYMPQLSFVSSQFTPPIVLAAPLPAESTPIVTSSPVAIGLSKDDTGGSPTSFLPSSSSPFSLDLLVAETIDTAGESSTPSPTRILPSLPSTSDFSVLLMSEEEMDIFGARLSSLFDMPSLAQATNSEAEPLVLADSLLEIIESSSTAKKVSLPPVDLGTCLDLLPSFSRIPFEALQKPIIKNGFLQCCKVLEQSNMAFSSHLSQAAATVDFYINICHMARAAEEELLRDKEFVSHMHAEVFELKGQHSYASQFRTQLLEKKAQLEEELVAVNLALDRNAKKLQITNQGLADRRQDMATAIQLFPSLRSRESIVTEQLKHCTDFWANLWLLVLKSL